MKYLVLPLERAFLHREFRSVRLILNGRSFIEPVLLPVSQPIPQLVTNRKPEELKVTPKPVLVYSYQNSISKEDIVSIKKHIDSEKTTLLQTPKPAFTFPQPVLQKTLATNTSKSRRVSRLSPRFRKFLFGGIIASCVIALTVLLGPSVYYSVFPSDPVPIKSTDTGSAMGGSYASGSSRVVSKIPAPVYDENLPEGNWLIIPKIGVKTEILESANSDEALNKGVWRVPDFGTPTDLSKPMILAAHRYGWKAWWENGNQYWKYHSFYLLPKLEKGDLIEVISNHRKYIYEVYAGEQGEDITDYNADLILYTCKFLDSPLRFFRYARLVDPNHPTSLSSK